MDLRRRLLPSAALAALSVAVAASFGRVFASARVPRGRSSARPIAPHAIGLLLRARRARRPPSLAASCPSSRSRAYVVWGLLLHTTTLGHPRSRDARTS